jgi:hypothetical protein
MNKRQKVWLRLMYLNLFTIPFIALFDYYCFNPVVYATANGNLPWAWWMVPTAMEVGMFNVGLFFAGFCNVLTSDFEAELRAIADSVVNLLPQWIVDL